LSLVRGRRYCRRRHREGEQDQKPEAHVAVAWQRSGQPISQRFGVGGHLLRTVQRAFTRALSS
jgi:hypothetical protein